MKKSELQSLIRETVSGVLIDMLPEIISMVQENSQGQIVESNFKGKDNGPSLIREKYKRLNPNSGAGYNLPSKPDNPKGVVNGETYASGKGIMEWFSKRGGKTAPQREFSYTEEDMEKFKKKLFGA
jgi:hypothetical protein